jgi:hypothetical protein
MPGTLPAPPMTHPRGENHKPKDEIILLGLSDQVEVKEMRRTVSMQRQPLAEILRNTNTETGLPIKEVLTFS